MAGDPRAVKSGLCPRPLPLIGVRRVLMQSRARMIFLIGARHSSDAQDSRAPLEWRAPMRFFQTREGVRAVWHKCRKILARLHLTPASMAGTRWRSGRRALGRPAAQPLAGVFAEACVVEGDDLGP